MGWNNRRNGMYYYQPYREGGKVKNRYIGNGELAELAATLDAIDRRDRSLRRAKEAMDAEAIRATDRLVRGVSQGIGDAVAEMMATAGYHRHNRNEWRRKRA